MSRPAQPGSRTLVVNYQDNLKFQCPNPTDYVVCFSISGEKLLKNIITFFIRLYQLIISPILPPSCRFTPTCSQYALDAIQSHGLGRGLYLAVCRILRCHPFHKGGFDPVNR